MSQKMKNWIRRSLCILLVFGVSITGMMFDKADAGAAGYPYLIKVNKQRNCVTVYKRDGSGNYTVPVKAMVCSVGWDTPVGTFRTPAKYRWRLMVDDVWSQYATRITGGILFHSVWYYENNPGTLSARQYNNLGITCSHGCVRLSVKDAKWIYDNCPVGTTVKIYNSSNAGPLGKPEAIKLPLSAKWDPTDIWSKNNPYNNKKPVISGVKNKTVKFASKVNTKSGVTAVSTTGFSITSRIKVKGTVNTNKAGKYKVTYSVTDQIGRKDTKTAVYVVLPDQEKPVLTGIKDKIVGPKVKITKAYVLKGVKAKLRNKPIASSKIKASIKKTGSTSYKITYYVKASNGKSVLKKSTIKVDNKAPVFKGVKNKTITYKDKMSKELMKKGVTVSDNITKMKKDDYKIIIKNNKNDTYSVTYEAVDGVGNKAKKTILVTIACSLELKGVKDQTVPAGTVVDRDYVMKGVTAKNKGKDITSSVKVTISDLIENQYTVTYTITDANGRIKTVKAIFTVEPVQETPDEGNAAQQDKETA